MRIEELKPAKGARKRRKIVGRGPGSRHGLSATKGTKGQNARSGRGVRLGFEGGQMPLVRRIPKRGFNSLLKKEYAIVNVNVLSQRFEGGSEINPEILGQKKLIKGKLPIKVLGDGEVDKILNIKVHAFSETAKQKVTKAGGTIKQIEYIKKK